MKFALFILEHRPLRFISVAPYGFNYDDVFKFYYFNTSGIEKLIVLGKRLFVGYTRMGSQIRFIRIH